MPTTRDPGFEPHPYFLLLIIVDLFHLFFYFARYRTIVMLQIYHVESQTLEFLLLVNVSFPI